MTTKSIPLGVTPAMQRSFQKVAKKSGLSMNALLNEAVRQYDALNTLARVSAHARRLIKKQGLTEKDFGGPFAK